MDVKAQTFFLSIQSIVRYRTDPDCCSFFKQLHHDETMVNHLVLNNYNHTSHLKTIKEKQFEPKAHRKNFEKKVIIQASLKRARLYRRVDITARLNLARATYMHLSQPPFYVLDMRRNTCGWHDPRAGGQAPK